MDKFIKYESLLGRHRSEVQHEFKESFVISIYTDLFEKDTVSLSMLHDYIIQVVARSFSGSYFLSCLIGDWCDVASTYRMKPTQFALDLVEEYKRRHTDESETCFVMPTFLGLESTTIKHLNDVDLPECLQKIEALHAKTPTYLI